MTQSIKDKLIFILQAIILLGFVGLTIFFARHHDKVDPAKAALEEARYTKVYFIGNRQGFCDDNQQYIQELIAANMMPNIERENSYAQNCTFGDKYIATDSVGMVEIGTVFCGPLVKLVPPFKYCAIYDNASLPKD
jgi:hypothetical protein